MVNPAVDVVFREADNVLTDVDAEIDAKADDAEGSGPCPFH